METHCNKLIHLHVVFLVIFSFLVSTISIEHVPTRFCGKIQIRTPFLNPNSTGLSSPLSRITLCKAEKLYFRTSIGLFQISSIDYTTKTLVISHSTSSSSKEYVPPSLLSAGFPPTPHPNSLLLFNCSNKRKNLMPPFIRNCSGLHVHASASNDIDHDSCLLVDDDGKLDKEFHPRDLKCSHYRRVHRRCLENKEVEFGTKVSFDIDVPDVCKDCKNPNGNCSAGLKCICHVKECKDKVVSLSGSLYSISCVLFSLLSSAAVMIFLIH